VGTKTPDGCVAAVFPEFIARDVRNPSAATVKGESTGWVRPAAQRGHGPVRLDSGGGRVTVAEKGDEFRKDG